MRFLSTAVGTGIVVALLAGCAGGGSSLGSAPTGGAGMPVAVVPQSLIKYAPFRGVIAPKSATRGIYVSEFYKASNNVIGYPKNERSNGPPICYESTGSSYVNDVDVDGRGNLLVPNAFSGVRIYRGPAMCGALLGTISDLYGQAVSAAANDAVNGVIVVANIRGSVNNNVVTCKLPSLRCSQLSSPNMGTVVAVAMDKAGNCYADAFDASGHVGLWVYRACTGTGTELTSANGFNEPYYGGLSVDNEGNLVVIALFNSSFSSPSTVTVYSGCLTGTCTTAGGPFELQGESIFGHLDRHNQRWVTTNVADGMAEVYSYARGGTVLTYLYSFDNGLACLDYECEAAAYSPGSPKL